MTTPSMALAVFVKTPGLSPIKTRLAAGLGKAGAAEFYRLAVAAVEVSVMSVVTYGIHPFWAVAEQEGMADARWQRFERLYQGTGSLGNRLGQVFSQLQAHHEIVAAIGADSPQVTSTLLHEAFNHFTCQPHRPTHALGRCHDGGFYFVGTNVSLPLAIWLEVPYSSADTADQIAVKLASLGSVVELPRLTDVDRVDDLRVLRRELEMISIPTDEQLALLDWLAGIERAS